MIVHRELGMALTALVLVAVTGCASMTSKPIQPTSAATPPAGSATGSAAGAHPAEPAPIVAPAGTTVDTTTPSPAAQHVLARIPEPLTPAQQALSPGQDTSLTRGRAVAPAAAYDSLQAAPVPSETQPLGTQTSTLTTSEPAAAASPAGAATGGAAGAVAAPTAGGAAAGGAATGTGAAATAADAPAGGAAAAANPTQGGNSPCWRLQVGAPLESEKEKADARLEAAQSLLVAPFTIVPEKGYLKVRTRDCMTRETADALKKRAVDSGFSDAFLIDTNASPPKPKHQRVPASKRKQ